MKIFENQLVFDEVMPKILLVPFFPDTVYTTMLVGSLCLQHIA